MLRPRPRARAAHLLRVECALVALRNRLIFYDYRWLRSSELPDSFPLAFRCVERINLSLVRPQGLQWP